MAVVSGCWKFKDVPVVQLMDEQVSFYSYNGSTSQYQAFYGIHAIGEDFLNFWTNKAHTAETWVFRASTGRWRDEKCKIIDFDTEPKTVSDTFFSWLEANAERIDGEIERIALGGVWIFNETLTFPATAIKQYVDFESRVALPSSGYDGWIGMKTDPTPRLYYGCIPSSLEGECVYSERGWENSVLHEGYRVVDFGEDRQDVDEAFYNWFTANAQPIGALVRYKGEVIAGLDRGQSATLRCGEKRAASDIAVSFGAGGRITYGENTQVYGFGQGATLRCEGKKMTSDCTVEAL